MSGLLWQGPPRRLMDLARQRVLTPCTSSTLLAELAEVIARDKFAQRVLAAQANLIVSGDRDLLDLHEYQGIPILTTTDTLQRLEAKIRG